MSKLPLRAQTVDITDLPLRHDLLARNVLMTAQRNFCLGNSPSITDSITFERRRKMSNSVYKIIELVGTSDTSWEDAAKAAVETAGKTLRDLRIAEVVKLDMAIQNGKVKAYRARITVSFKYKK
jgi:flavin-binding protein dodecin